MARQLFIGVDGGGTKCRMRLADADLKTLGEAVTERPSNLQVRGGDAAFEAIKELTGKVFSDAGIDESEAGSASACFGMAGGRLTSAREAFEKRDFPFANVKVYDDIDIARAGAHGEGDGAVLIIGTGSAAMALIDGKRYQIGGWGFHVSDTMSGAILGRELLRLSLLAHDGLIEGSPLTEAVMAEFKHSGDEMMAWSFNNDAARKAMAASMPVGTRLPDNVPARPGDYGTFAKFVSQYLEKGDPVAKQLLEFELDAIAQFVDWLTARGAKSIAIVGGVGHGFMKPIRERFGDIIIEKEPDSLHGALVLARQHFAAA